MESSVRGGTVQMDPTKRPNMEKVIVRFDKIRRSLSGWKLRSRVVDDDEDGFERITRTCFTLSSYALHHKHELASIESRIMRGNRCHCH